METPSPNPNALRANVAARAREVRDVLYGGRVLLMARALGWQEPRLYRALAGATRRLSVYDELARAIARRHPELAGVITSAVSIATVL